MGNSDWGQGIGSGTRRDKGGGGGDGGDKDGCLSLIFGMVALIAVLAFVIFG